MHLGVIAAQAPAQVAVQGHEVEMGLERVVACCHQGGHRCLAVMAGTAGQGLAIVIALTQPVALPVGHPPAPVPSRRIRIGSEHQVDRAGEEAAAVDRKLGKAGGVVGAEQAAWVVGEGGGQIGGAHPLQGEVEIHLVQAAGGRQIRHPQPL